MAEFAAMSHDGHLVRAIVGAGRRGGDRNRRRAAEGAGQEAGEGRREEASTRSRTKARTRDSLQALSKLAELVDGQYRIVSQPPIVVPLRDLGASAGMSRRRDRAS